MSEGIKWKPSRGKPREIYTLSAMGEFNRVADVIIKVHDLTRDGLAKPVRMTTDLLAPDPSQQGTILRFCETGQKTLQPIGSIITNPATKDH